MKLIESYIFKRMLGAFVLTLVTLSTTVWMTQALRAFDLVTGQGQSVGTFFRITVLLLPVRGESFRIDDSGKAGWVEVHRRVCVAGPEQSVRVRGTVGVGPRAVADLLGHHWCRSRRNRQCPRAL